MDDRARAWMTACRAAYARIPVLGFPNDPDFELSLDAIGVDVLVQPRMHHDGLGLRGEDDRARPLGEALGRAVDPGEPPCAGLVLLGAPGSGKTTLLRRFFVEAMDQSTRRFGLADTLFPVFARLSRLRREHLVPRGLAALVEAEATESGHPGAGAALLRGDGPWLFLLDGLDEVRDPEVRAKAGAWLAEEAGRWDRAVFVVTSRPAGYRECREVERLLVPGGVRPLTAEAVTTYVQKWYPIALKRRLDYEERRDARRLTELDAEAERRAAKLLAEIQRRDREEALSWRDLSRNPLLLSALCLVAHDEGVLPRGRGELYRRCLEQLLRVATRRGEAGLPVEPAQRVLQPLAWAMHDAREDGELTEWTDAQAAAVIEAPLRREAASFKGLAAVDFLARVVNDTGVLHRPAEERVRFAHLTFQEYLAARHAQSEEAARTALAARFGKARWEEPILLAVAMPGVFGPLMREVLARGVAGQERLLQRCREETTDARTPLVDWLGEGGTWAPTWLGGRRTGDLVAVLRAVLGTEDEAVRSAAARWGGHRDPTVAGLARRVAGREEGGRLWIEPKSGIECVWVPAETFLYGEEKRPIVEPEGFWIGRFPVTNEEYRRFVKATGALAPPLWDDTRFNRPRQPVVGMAWDEAVAYCAWAGGFLPTEEQWEHMARGADGREYPWGPETPTATRAAFEGDIHAGPPDVGAHPDGRSPCGAEDVAGTVWEWTMTPWQDHDNTRVLRGGSWGGEPEGLRCVARLWDHLVGRNGSVGFRVGFRSAPRLS